MSNTDKDAKKKLLEEIKADYRKSKAKGEPKRAKAPRVSKYDIKRALKIATIAAMGLFGAPKMSAQNNHVPEISVEQLASMYNSPSSSAQAQYRVLTPSEYVEAHRLVPCRQLSRGLDRRIYYGAFINENVHPKSDERVVFVPRNLELNSVRRTTTFYAQHQQKQRTDMYAPVRDYGYYDGYGYNGHVHHSRPRGGNRKAENVVKGVVGGLLVLDAVLNSGR